MKLLRLCCSAAAYAFGLAGEFGGDSRQKSHFVPQGFTGLATLFRGNTLPRALRGFVARESLSPCAADG